MKLLIILILSIFISTAEACDFLFTPQDNLVIGYKFYCGPTDLKSEWSMAADLVGAFSAGNQWTFPVNLTSVPEGVSFCAMTSYNSMGESGHSNTITFQRTGDIVTNVEALETADFSLNVSSHI